MPEFTLVHQIVTQIGIFLSQKSGIPVAFIHRIFFSNVNVAAAAEVIYFQQNVKNHSSQDTKKPTGAAFFKSERFLSKY